MFLLIAATWKSCVFTGRSLSLQSNSGESPCNLTPISNKPPLWSSPQYLAQLWYSATAISCAAMFSGYIRKSAPTSLRIAPLSGLRNSLLSILATVFFAPSLFAIAQLVILRVSYGVTAIYRSALDTPTSLRLLNEDVDPFHVIRL